MSEDNKSTKDAKNYFEYSEEEKAQSPDTDWSGRKLYPRRAIS